MLSCKAKLWLGSKTEGLILDCNSKCTDSSHILLKPLIHPLTAQLLWENLLWKHVYYILCAACIDPHGWWANGLMAMHWDTILHHEDGHGIVMPVVETWPGRVCSWPSNLNPLNSPSICGLGAEGPQAHQRWLHGGLDCYMGPKTCQLTPTVPENPISAQDGKGKEFNALTSTASSPSCFPSWLKGKEVNYSQAPLQTSQTISSLLAGAGAGLAEPRLWRGWW